MVFDDKRERHWRMFFKDNNGGVDGTNALIHDKNWYVQNSDRKALVKGSIQLRFLTSTGKR